MKEERMALNAITFKEQKRTQFDQGWQFRQ
jgi:hypothetical protein